MKVSGCTKYEVQYATNRSYFDSNPDQVHSRTVENVTHTEITGIETGYQYFFRLRAYNSNDQVSGWSAIKSLKLGKTPGAPTTWSSTTTATVGESVRLYWVHNSEDTSTVNRGREIVHRETDPQFSGEPTNRQVKDYATSLLSQLSSVEYTISYSHGYCPVRLYDCVRLNYERAGLMDIKAKVTRQSIECKPGCKVTETAVFTTNLWR